MYVEREITREFNSMAKISGIVAVVGPRQAGKTTFLKERAGKAGASYLLFDDPDVRELFDDDIKRFENQYLRSGKPTVLDEVQYGKEPGRKLKYLADTGKRLWVTSSSEILLGKDVLSWLVGRVSVLRLYPFSFSEFLAAKGQREVTETVAARLMGEHMTYGGYPKVVLENDAANREALLRGLYETMVLKDIARAFQIEDAGSLERFITYMSHSIGNVLEYNSICRDLGLSFQSVKKYLDALEKSYMISRVAPFYRNRRSEITKRPKLYFIDTGLRNTIAREFSPTAETKGALFENYVMTELLKAGKTVKYWRSKGGAEVDFVVEHNGKTVPIEVKYKADGSIVERSMRSFIDSYKPKTGFVVFSRGEEASTKVGECDVRFIGLRKLTSLLGKR